MTGLTAAAAEWVQDEQVHPVLIRKEVNPFLRVRIVADAPARLRSLTFTLEGTDDLQDLELVEVLAGSTPSANLPAARFGGALAASPRVVFRGDLALSPGTNVLWLSTRLRESAALNHRVAARCVGVEADTGPMPETAGSMSAPARHRIGVALRKAFDEGVHTHRIPVLATTGAGTLLAAYDLRRLDSGDLQGDIDIGLSRSVDGGRRWEAPRVIMDMGEFGGLPQVQNGCSDPGILVDRQTGEIFVFALWVHGKPGQHQWRNRGSEPGFEVGKTAQLLVVRSTDDGKTWSRPENLTRALKKQSWWLFATAPQQGIQLEDGTLIMPAQGRDDTGYPFATFFHSRDHGAHWTVGTPAYSGGNECQAAALSDGSILLNVRNDRNRSRAVFSTSDLGQSWRQHSSHETLIEPNCNASLISLTYKHAGQSRRALLFCNPRSTTARTHQTLQVSFDDGRTWPESHRFLVDEGRGAGYPSLSRVDDDHIGLVYEGSQAQIVFERFSLKELGLLNPP